MIDLNEARRKLAEGHHASGCSAMYDRGGACDCYLATMRAALDELEQARAERDVLVDRVNNAPHCRCCDCRDCERKYHS